MTYGIKAWVFAKEGEFREQIAVPPFKSMTGYDKLHEFMKPLHVEPDIPITGYLALLIPEDKWKEEAE